MRHQRKHASILGAGAIPPPELGAIERRNCGRLRRMLVCTVHVLLHILTTTKRQETMMPLINIVFALIDLLRRHNNKQHINMASPAASSVLFLVIAVFTAGASAATFNIKNNCPYTVWPAATPVGGGRQLNSGQTWTLNVPAGTSSGRVWGRTGCSFNGDCGGALACTLSGQPPLRLAEFTIGHGQDFYDISVIDGYNVPMSFSCSNGPKLVCKADKCPDAYLFPADNKKNHACNGNNNNSQVVFCP
ncbi:hypothetical protein EJB05_57837, partial [Eragrostis curvula]